MPRQARLILPGVPVHVIQRGNNRQACFYDQEDYRFYLKHLAQQSESAGCAVHAYCLMTNHVHLLLTPDQAGSLGVMMKGLGQRYVQYINRTYRRSGTLWEGRFKSCIAWEESYVLACYRYIELNPVRAAMVEHPGDYPWSSYRSNAQGEASSFLVKHPVYEALGGGAQRQAAAYRELFRYELDPGVVDDIRQATQGNYALGSARFKAEVEAALGRRVTRGKPGRKPRNRLPITGPGLEL